MKFRKYEFTPAKWAELKASIEVSHEMGEETHVGYNQELVVAVVELGHLVVTPAVMEDMEVVEPAVLADKYSVDILWRDEEAEGFSPYQIWCEPIGCHSFGSDIDAEYIAEFEKR